MDFNCVASAFSSHLIGRVIDNTGAPVKVIHIHAFPNSGGNVSQATTDGNGNYNLGVNGGSWNVQLNNDPKSGTPSLGLIGPNLSFNIINGESRSNIVLVAQRANATLTVSVRDSSNNPLEAVTVSADTTLNGANYSAVASSVTGANGQVALALFNGNWSIKLRCDGLSQRGYDCGFGQTVTVSGGSGTANIIVQRSGGPLLQVSTTSLPSGVVGQSYSTQLQASGGKPSYSWSLAPGSSPLPPGLGLSTVGGIQGTPTSSVTFSFTVRVTDASSQTADRGLSIRISPDTPPSLASSSPANNASGVALNSTISFTFSEPMQSGIQITWSESMVADSLSFNWWTYSMVADSLSYNWSTDQRTLICTSNTGLPPDTTIHWALNQNAVGDKFRDLAGNALLYDSGNFTTGASTNGTWSYKPFMPTARTGPGAAIINGLLYVVGGQGRSGSGSALLVSALEVYDPNQGTWQSLAPMPTARTHPAVGVIDGKLYVAGGANLEAGLKTVEAYDPVSNTWSNKQPMNIHHGGAAGVISNKLYVVGPSTDFTKSLEVYDPITDTWTFKTPMPNPRFAGAAALNGLLYTVGGDDFGTVEAYDPTTDSWSSKASLPGKRGRILGVEVLPGVAVLNSKLYVLSFYNNGSRVVFYDPTSNQWSYGPSMLSGRSELAAAALSDRLFAVGGLGGLGGGPPLPFLEQLSLSTNDSVVTLVLRSDSSTLAAGLGSGVPSSAMLNRLNTGDTSGLTFQSALVSSVVVDNYLPTGNIYLPTGSPIDTQVVNIPPGNGQNGFFQLSFVLPPGYSGAQISCGAQMDYYGRAFLNGNALTPAIDSSQPRPAPGTIVSGFVRDTFFSTKNPAFFHTGTNYLVFADINADGGASAGAFFCFATYRVHSPTVGTPTITQQSVANYTAGSSFQVTNSFTYTGQLLSLLWRPQLPSGWTLGAVTGDGNPKSNFGEIVWPGSLPASPIKMVYTVQVPAGQSGSKQVRGQVEYQFSGSANPVSGYAGPDPIAISSAGGTQPEPFKLTDLLRLPNGSFQLRLVGEANRSYTVQASTDLVNWIPVFTGTSTGGSFTFTDSNASGVGPRFNHRFYRALVSAPSVIETATQTISGSAGGTVRLPSGGQVTIPPGMFAAETIVKFSLISSLPQQPPNGLIVGVGPAVSLSFSPAPARLNGESPRARSAGLLAVPAADELQVFLPYGANTVSRALGSAPIADSVADSGEHGFQGVRGGYNSADNAAHFRIPAASVQSARDLYLSLANLNLERVSQLRPVPPHVIWNRGEWEPLPPIVDRTKKTLVVVHGFNSTAQEAFGGCVQPQAAGECASCVEEIMKKGGYEQVIGFNYNYLDPGGVEENGRQLATFLDSLGISTVDIEAHSKGGLVALSAANKSNVRIENMVLLGAPIMGSPIANVAEHFLTLMMYLDRQDVLGVVLDPLGVPRDPLDPLDYSLERLLKTAWGQDFQTGSPTLARIRDKFEAQRTTTKLILAAGTVPSDLNKLPDAVARNMRKALPVIFGEPFDTLVGQSSALAMDWNRDPEKTVRLKPYPLSHTELECNTAVISDVAANLSQLVPVLDVSPKTPLHFSVEGDFLTRPQAITVRNAGEPGSVLEPTVSSSAPTWLDVAGPLNLRLPPGESAIYDLTILNGALLTEGNHRATITITAPSALRSPQVVEVTVTVSRLRLPAISIDGVSVTEGNSGTVNASFLVTLSSISAVDVTVDFATANGTAAAGSDYVASSGKLTIPAGVLGKFITVSVIGDTLLEPNETFVVNLSSPAKATIAKGQGTATIRNDDQPPLPNLSIDDVTVTEGNSGTINASFLVTLSSVSAVDVTVDFATADGTAVVGSDYLASSGKLTIPAGVLGRFINVLVNGDTAVESNKTFLLKLSNPINATIKKDQGIATIVNDDIPPFVITTTSLRSASNQGLPKSYFEGVFATGGVPPGDWKAVGLPPGFTLIPLQDTSTGKIICDEVRISGFPGNGQPPAGDYPVEIRGVDSLGRTAAKTVTLSIGGAATSFNLTVIKAGNGSGSVNPVGGNYANGTMVTLIATPDAGSAFTGWSEDASGTSPSYLIKMDSNKSVTAAFSKTSSPPENWGGTWRVTSPGFCFGVNGTWSATITDSNGVLSGTWTTSFGDSGTISGTRATATFGSTTGVAFDGAITGNTISGKFTGDSCTGRDARVTGTFIGAKR